ncbi:MAG: hypothetical protein HC929_15290 [Leptolyngbyaceae cyanobacterium SM2_5_2]|nr:hypothetical protein [Leptolyngbyaceae cyanobacterium SM2_5_2]
MKSAMQQPIQPLIRIPVVAVLCALVFLGYGLGASPEMAVVCDAPQSLASPIINNAQPSTAAVPSAHCQVCQGRRLGVLPAITTDFDLQDVAITSRLCDNTPRGGVRFCHHLTLIGDRATVTLPEIRTPLTAATLMDNLHRFMAGQGNSSAAGAIVDRRLSWTTPRRLTTSLSTAAMGGLLAMAAWGLWAVKWPPLDPSPLALDGELSPEPEPKPKKD